MKEWKNKNHKEYYIKNRDKKLKYAKRYRDLNKDKQREYMSIYYENNKEKIHKQRLSYQRKRRQTDIGYKIVTNMRSRLGGFLGRRGMNKDNKTMKYVGCNKNELVKHLESLFTDGMTWDNYGRDGWHIDHIIPMTHFNLNNEDEIYMACNYKNLQPLWAIDNIRKGNKLLI